MRVSCLNLLKTRNSYLAVPLTGYLHMVIGFLFTYYLSVIDCFGLIPGSNSLIHNISKLLRDLINKFDYNIVTETNPANRLAVQMNNRWITIVGGRLYVSNSKNIG